MRDCCAAANLPPLFLEGSLPKEIEQLWPAFEKAFRSDNRGTNLGDMLAFSSSSSTQVLPQSRLPKLDEGTALIRKHLNARASG